MSENNVFYQASEPSSRTVTKTAEQWQAEANVDGGGRTCAKCGGNWFPQGRCWRCAGGQVGPVESPERIVQQVQEALRRLSDG